VGEGGGWLHKYVLDTRVGMCVPCARNGTGNGKYVFHNEAPGVDAELLERRGGKFKHLGQRVLSTQPITDTMGKVAISCGFQNCFPHPQIGRGRGDWDGASSLWVRL